MTIELRELSLDDGAEILDMLKEIGPGENGFVNSGCDLAYADFASYLQNRADMAKGIGIDLDRYVPQTTYWLIVDGRPVGMGKLRHYLNDFLQPVITVISYKDHPRVLVVSVVPIRERHHYFEFQLSGFIDTNDDCWPSLPQF